MKINITIPENIIKRTQNFFDGLNYGVIVAFLASLLAVIATYYSYSHHLIIAYGDAESHLNIAKRVISGLTPGFAQLGGIWLPIPHLMLVPFVFSDFLWRTGLAGSIVSGFCFVVSAIFIYKTTFYITKNKYGGFAAAFIFMTNLNALYMQTTPMTELPLILFLVLSTYYFVVFLEEDTFQSLIMAGLWGLAASLSRYDGWFLVLIEAFIIFIRDIRVKKVVRNIKERGIGLLNFISEKTEGELVLYSTLSFIGILGWFIWDGLILGDPFYFTNSQFSAKSQQQTFLTRGMLQAFHNFPLSFIYYFATSMETVGILIFGVSLVALIIFLLDKKIKNRFYLVLLITIPFIFNVVTLYMGQSILFIPSITPASFEWRLFNVRYGMMAIPAVAIFIGYLFSYVKNYGKIIITVLVFMSFGLFAINYTRIISLDDGTIGLSHAVHPDAETFLRNHWDDGLVLMDDYARTISVIGTNIPMQDFVYVGTKPYWDDALKDPQTTVKWVVMQKNDAVWTALYDDQEQQAKLYTYFHKVYTSPNILIFERD